MDCRVFYLPFYCDILHTAHGRDQKQSPQEVPRMLTRFFPPYPWILKSCFQTLVCLKGIVMHITKHPQHCPHVHSIHTIHSVHSVQSAHSVQSVQSITSFQSVLALQKTDDHVCGSCKVHRLAAYGQTPTGHTSSVLETTGPSSIVCQTGTFPTTTQDTLDKRFFKRRNISSGTLRPADQVIGVQCGQSGIQSLVKTMTSWGKRNLYIKLLEFGYEPSSVGQLRNQALCKLSFEPKSINSQKQ